MKTQVHANTDVSEPSLQNKIEKISTANCEQDIVDICSAIAEDLETSYFTYTLLLPNDFHNHRYKRISNINSTWADRYETKSYVLIDPIFKQCIQSFIPVFWDTQRYDLKKESVEAKNMFEDAHQHGLRAGILVSVFDFYGANGVFELGLDADLYNNQSRKHLERIAPYLSYLGGFIHHAMIKILNQEEYEQKEPLTKREKDCLCWAADGKTASEIGSKLFISENTVKFHSKNIMKKLGAKNTVQALAIGILNGEIKPAI